MIKDYHNISNYFVETNDVSTDITSVLAQMKDSIFGLEIEMTEGVTNKLLVTPPYARLREHASQHYRETPTDEFTAYRGYLSKPFFLPLYGALEGQLLNDLEEMILPDRDKLCIQWLFRRKYNWKEKALEMFQSYVNGNDFPAGSRIARKFQDRTLGFLGKLMPFDPNEYVEAAEEKILSDGFQFQLRIAIKSDQQKKILAQLQDIFRKYDSHNSLKLYRDKNKGFHTLYENCILEAETSDQILSSNELFSLLGGKSTAPVVPVAQAVKRAVTDILQLLPLHPRENVQADESLVEQIAGALKRVGLVKQARLYNESITAGIRLTVVQADIPKGKNLTHLVSKQKDIQAALGVPSVGIEQGDTPDTVKFVIPNDAAAIISLRELLELQDFQEYAKKNPLAFVVGVDEINNPIFLSLAKLVHLLVAGTTGSGKSVFVNSLIMALILNYGPDLLRFIMIDPKEVELQQYEGFPHVDKVVTDMDEAYAELGGLVEEMDNRYTTFRENGVKNITLYNKKFPNDPMPYMVCVVDEYADLRDTHKEVEDHIARLGQKARAAGIHLVIATQRPSTDILSGRIKANIPNAISFNLNNNNNYKTVFGTGIGYKLLGRGDGVMKIEGYPKEFQRFQSSIISPDESQEEEIVTQLKDYFGAYRVNIEGTEEEPVQEESVTEPDTDSEEEVTTGGDFLLTDDTEEDSLYRLKQIIATTRETRVEALRKQLGVRTTKMKDLMTALVDQGWLVKHKDRSKGYQLVASDSLLSEWKSDL
ncbi:FtsK/SpoIIIE protein [Bacillus phage P59]|nr:FtsK/SpoIIIE protein [Bacillus phage P59]